MLKGQQQGTPAAMRVGYVVKRYPRYSETFIVNEILAHEAAGLDVRIFALLPPLDTHFQDLISRVRAPVHYLPALAGRANGWWAELALTAQVYPAVWETLATAHGNSAREVLQALVLAQEIKKQGITHLHAHFATAATTVARLAAGICDIPYTFTAHAKDIFHESVDQASLSTMVSDAAAAVTVSDFNLDYLNRRCGRQAGRIVRIYNGLDLNCFEYSDPTARPAEIIAVGRLVEKKGFACLIEACRLLAVRGRRFHCRIIGSGELEQDLRNRITAAGIEEQVELTGPQPQQVVKDAIRSAAVFAAPCIVGQDGNRDGLPTVLLESMALGTPCVSTDVTGIPEILQDGVTGLQVEQDNPAALATALEVLLADPSLRASVAQRARAQIEAEFDVHRNAARLRDCFYASDIADLELTAGAA
jgi:glycosyltransferase involved in cell wall biosynthesis